MGLEDLNTLPEYDLVLCLGILYHMKDPYKLIRDLYKITKHQLILETHTEFNSEGIPLMVFYPTNELNNDNSNWWGPNTVCLLEMLKSVGFKDIKMVYLQGNNGRAVFHAFK